MDKAILFLPPRDAREEKWTGPKLAPGDANVSAQTGFPVVLRASLLQSELDQALKSFPKIYTAVTAQPESGEESHQREMLASLRKIAPLASTSDIQMTLAKMRAVKSAGEIALIRKATEASIEAHLAALKAVRPGVHEYEVGARMKYEFERLGCEWPAYSPIVGSGVNSTVLHYGRNDREMKAGDLVVMDVAGAYGGYTSDITRTLPASGRFTPRQREIYEIVLGAENAALAAVRPGVKLRRGKNSVHEAAADYINTHGKDLKGNPLGQYFIHYIGHSVGLNVHDPIDYEQPLEPGMVVTIEPGIYLPDEDLGVRIEDLILITSDGYEMLTRRLPRTVEEIERLMSAH